MIGQENLLIQINELIDKGFPRFSIITGRKGQGKKMIANYIARKLNCNIVNCDTKIDSIREIIQLAYKQTEPIIYLIADADKMSLAAKNSLLKIIEEPPNNAYFIMTLLEIENTLETIKSRCMQLKMEDYSINELNRFIDDIDINISSTERAILQDACSNGYEIKLVHKYGTKDFYNYVENVVNHIYRVQSANSFKLAEKLDLKDNGEGYDLGIFLNLFREICLQELFDLINTNEEDCKCYGNSITVTSKAINELNITGINKQALIDIWILDIRKIWREI